MDFVHSMIVRTLKRQMPQAVAKLYCRNRIRKQSPGHGRGLSMIPVNEPCNANLGNVEFVQDRMETFECDWLGVNVQGGEGCV